MARAGRRNGSREGRVNKQAAALIGRAKNRFETTGQEQRLFGDLFYEARTWDRRRRVITRIQHDGKDSNPRYVVTNLKGRSKWLYERVYCARGEMENRIKEQMQLFSDRTSPTRWWPNPFRLLLSS